VSRIEVQIEIRTLKYPRNFGSALYNLPYFNRLAKFCPLFGMEDGFESNLKGPAPVEPEIFTG
jgi:hypothetical protein